MQNSVKSQIHPETPGPDVTNISQIIPNDSNRELFQNVTDIEMITGNNINQEHMVDD